MRISSVGIIFDPSKRVLSRVRRTVKTLLRHLPSEMAKNDPLRFEKRPFGIQGVKNRTLAREVLQTQNLCAPHPRGSAIWLSNVHLSRARR